MKFLIIGALRNPVRVLYEKTARAIKEIENMDCEIKVSKRIIYFYYLIK